VNAEKIIGREANSEMAFSQRASNPPGSPPIFGGWPTPIQEGHQLQLRATGTVVRLRDRTLESRWQADEIDPMQNPGTLRIGVLKNQGNIYLSR